PGGYFEPEHWYFGTDQFSPIPQQPDYYSGTPLRDHFRWIYFGNTTSDGVLYFAQEQADHQLDIVSYLGNDPALRLKSSDGMTVFGFGRGDEAQPLLTTPHEFIVGYFPHPIRDPMDHQFFKEFIDRKLK
ncbi:MAG: hypothetical protein KTR24_17260, partial [Saprospiraceae bacterium]|nr:hypothetical protein [Saprospiraceae bacterium]